MPRVHIDLQREYDRMRVAAEVRIAFEGIWWREGSGVVGGSRRLAGPWGETNGREIEGQFAPGPKPLISRWNEQTNTAVEVEGGYPLRWAQLQALADLSAASSPLQQAKQQLAMLYRKPIEVSGDIVCPSWLWLSKQTNINQTLQWKQELEIGLEGCAVRPSLKPFKPGSYYPPRLTVRYPEQAIAVEDPARPGQAGLYQSVVAVFPKADKEAA